MSAIKSVWEWVSSDKVIRERRIGTFNARSEAPVESDFAIAMDQDIGVAGAPSVHLHNRACGTTQPHVTAQSPPQQRFLSTLHLSDALD